MNTIENQYAYFFSQLGYTTEFYPDKSLFYLNEAKTYCKVCDDPAPPDIVEKATEQSKKHDIILLEGGLSYKTYRLFSGGQQCNNISFVTMGYKYFPFFYEYDFNPEFWEKECVAITLAIRCGEDLECHQCGAVNDFIISKPSIHYKATCKCGAYITNVSENKPSHFHFGKFKGRAIKSMATKEEIDYLNWGLSQNVFKGKLKKDIQERVAEL